jgi:4-amino-4-deoxy-L-arabinose transferase-like glycosyltransferase
VSVEEQTATVFPSTSSTERPHVAWVPVGSAMGALLLALALTASQYGYHRDELYFRMLPPAWGYVDQPPLTPLIVKFTLLFGDQSGILRIPAIVFAVVSVLIVALIAREVGGRALAQGLAAWGYAFGAVTLIMGHTFLTASLDLVVWPLVLLFVIRVFTRGQQWWWLLAGVVAGLSMYNKLLIAMLLVAIALGILIAGPRRALASWWPFAGVGIVLLIGLPNLVYQVANAWPQLRMGAALEADNGADVRALLGPFILLMLGPPLVPIWIAGIVALLRRREWRMLRWLPVALLVGMALVFIAGSQVYYGYGLLATVYAIGCVPAAQWATRVPWRRGLLIAAVALNSVVSIMLSLPVLPVGLEAKTPIGGLDQAIRDQVGWPTYVAQVEHVVSTLPAGSGTTIIFATNYGEAGALDRYLPAGSPKVYSGHNALGLLPPPAKIDTAVIVGAQFEGARRLFRHCRIAGHLNDEIGMDNEEQGQPIGVCTGPSLSPAALLAAARHLS